MRKQFYLICALFILSGIYPIHADSDYNKKLIYRRTKDKMLITIKDLILFQNFTNEQIHKYLILYGWEYTGTTVDGRGGSFLPHQLKSANYKNEFNDVIISILEIDHFENSKKQVINYTERSISVTTESLIQHRALYYDLRDNNFKLKSEQNYPAYESATGEVKDILIRMEKEFVYAGGSNKYYTNSINDINVETHMSKKFDSNNELILRARYILTIKYDINSLKGKKEDNNIAANNQELLNENNRLKRENDSLISFYKGAVVLSAKGAANIERALESIKEKNLKITKLQEALIKKDSVIEQILKKNKK